MALRTAGNHHIGTTAPSEEPVDVGHLWTDLTAVLLKRCTSIGPYTWVSVEGGAGGAPVDASYVCLGTNGTLSNERVLTAGTNITFTDNGPGNTLVVDAASGGGAGNSVTANVDFGATFTDKAQVVVTGQAWVGANSEIVAKMKTPTGVDPDEMRLLGFQIVISDLVPGDGFTVTVYSEPEAKGTYDVMCVGV